MAEPVNQFGFCQEIVAQQVEAAADACSAAQNYLSQLATMAGTLSTYVDTNIGASVNPVAGTITALAMPDEPDYSSGAPGAVTIPSVVAPTTAQPTYAVDITGTPEALAAPDWSTVPVLDTLPEITATTPTMDVSLLTTDFAFTEPTYTERLSTEIEAGITSALAGNMGLPAGYWTALWAEVSGDLARQQVAALRQARNKGAASYWGLPGETVLASSQAVLDEGQRKLSMARLEQAKQQAVFAREDFWQSIKEGLAYEKVWVDFHEQMANRALTAAEQLYLCKVQVHNANVARFNAALEKAKADGVIQDLKVQRVLKKLTAELQINAVELEQDGALVKRFQAEWAGYQIDTATQIADFGEQLRKWMGLVDTDAKFQALGQTKADLDLKNYSNVLSKIDTLARATAQVLQARIQRIGYDLEGQKAEQDAQIRAAMISVEAAKLTQAAQEAEARLSIAQSQWSLGAQAEVVKAVAANAFNLASALVAASDVGLSATVNEGINYNYNQKLPDLE